jgi:hypothetical protein
MLSACNTATSLNLSRYRDGIRSCSPIKLTMVPLGQVARDCVIRLSEDGVLAGLRICRVVRLAGSFRMADIVCINQESEDEQNH